MGKLDEFKNKAKGMVSENRDRIEEGLDKAGDMINQRTGGKHEDKIDQGLAKAKQGLDRAEGHPQDTTTEGMTERPAGDGAATPPPQVPPQPPGPLVG